MFKSKSLILGDLQVFAVLQLHKLSTDAAEILWRWCAQAPEQVTCPHSIENGRNPPVSPHLATLMSIIYMLAQRQRPQDKNQTAPLCMWVSYFAATIAQNAREPVTMQRRGELAQWCWDGIVYSEWETHKIGKCDIFCVCVSKLDTHARNSFESSTPNCF